MPNSCTDTLVYHQKPSGPIWIGCALARAWLDRAKWVRAKAVKSALAADYSLRTVAEIARVAPSTVLRIGSQELPAEPPPA